MKYFSLIALLAINIFCCGSSKTPAYFKYFFTVVEGGRERVIETSLIEAEKKDFSRESLMKFGNKLPFKVKKVGMVIYEHDKVTPTQHDRYGREFTKTGVWSLWHRARGDFKNEQDKINRYKSALEKSNSNIFAPKPSEFKMSDDRLSAPLLEYLQIPISASYEEKRQSTKPLLYIDQNKSPDTSTTKQELKYLVIDLERSGAETIEFLDEYDSTKIYIDQTELVK
jgi:hypothetical protein